MASVTAIPPRIQWGRFPLILAWISLAWMACAHGSGADAAVGAGAAMNRVDEGAVAAADSRGRLHTGWWWGDFWRLEESRREYNNRLRERDQAQQARNAAANERATAEAELKTAERQRDAALAELQRLQGQLNPVVASKVEAEKRRDSLRQQAAAASNAIAQAQQQASQSKAQKRQLEAAIAGDEAATQVLRQEMEKLQREIAAVKRDRDAAASHMEARLGQLRSEAAALTTKIDGLRSKMNGEKGDHNKLLRELGAQEAAARSVTSRTRSAMDQIHARTKKLTDRITKLQDRLEAFQTTLRKKLDAAVRSIEDERRALVGAKGEKEKELKKASDAKSMATAALGDATARLNATRAAHAALRQQRNDEMAAIRRAMDAALQAAAEATAKHEAQQRERVAKMESLADASRNATAAAQVAERVHATNMTMLQQDMDRMQARKKEAMERLEAAKTAHEGVKQRLKEEQRRVEEETQALRFRIGQEEAAYAMVRRRLENERNAALAEVTRLSQEHRRAEMAHNATLVRLEVARAGVEGALAMSQATAEREANQTRTALEEMVRDAAKQHEARAKALAEAKEAHKVELTTLNANLTQLEEVKTQLSAQVRNLVADRARAVDATTQVATKLEQARALMAAGEGDKRALQLAVAGFEVQLQQANDVLAEVQRGLTLTQRRIKEAQQQTTLAANRKTELEGKVEELRGQQKRLDANAEAIEKAMAAVKVDGTGGQREVQEALFNLGQKMEATQSEKARLEEAAAGAERAIAELMASKVVLEQAVAALNARAASATELGVSATGADGPLAAYVAAQASVDAAKEAGGKEEAVAARERSDTADVRDRAIAQAKAELEASRKALDSVKVHLSSLRGGALPREVEAQLAAAKRSLAEANALTTEQTTAEAVAQRQAEADRQHKAHEAAVSMLSAQLDQVKAGVAEAAAKAAAAASGGPRPSLPPPTHVTRVFMGEGAEHGGDAIKSGTGPGGGDSLLAGLFGFSDLQAGAGSNDGGTTPPVAAPGQDQGGGGGGVARP